ncbi:unnamed protein product [Triticum turgidum subsp. durum]|uniref:Phosphatidic acid phosphatase type 2/haloperoxidase domain-containing protein n=1 Tax=Triticum turgidum subsp. durum TaxID=4567 RepID=A0A9R0QID4_TRITD|nr:unnamed protein product [Triticum turgidum subsp. durum]
MPPPGPAAAAAIQLGVPPPYLRTHGAKMARRHMYDWIVLLLLAAIEVVLNLITPFHRFVAEFMMDDLRYPMKPNTIPVWAVPIYAVILPMLIFAAIYVKKKNAYDLHHAILVRQFIQNTALVISSERCVGKFAGLLFSVLITGVLTDAIKDGVGRPRPNFYYRCFPDGVPNYEAVTRQVICHGDAKVIKEGHKSFPSGHTSWSFAGLGFLSWYLAGKIRVFDRGGHIAKLCIVILPLLFAAMVGVSRVADYWHHWQDVFAGGILGLVVASFCYLQFFPHPASKHGLWPHAFQHHNPNPETENQGTTDAHQSVLPHDLSVVQYVTSMEMRTNGRALDNMEAGSGRAW